MLVFRMLSFAFWQAVIAAIFMAQANPAPWEASIAWWPVTAIITNITCLFLLALLSRREGIRLRDLYRVERHAIKRELFLCLGLTVVATPIALIPNLALATWLFGDVQVPGTMWFRPLPHWVILPSLILFPVTIALSELPTYYSYAMPRLAILSNRAWSAVLLAALWHAAQHIALPLIFDGRFLLWRFGMLAPFALFVAICLYRRPRLLPYLMVLHGLMDLQLVLMAFEPALR
jgi:hypothetical protein